MACPIPQGDHNKLTRGVQDYSDQLDSDYAKLINLNEKKHNASIKLKARKQKKVDKQRR